MILQGPGSSKAITGHASMSMAPIVPSRMSELATASGAMSELPTALGAMSELPTALGAMCFPFTLLRSMANAVPPSATKSAT